VEIRRFGVGHRRREGPAGTRGVDGQPIHADHRGSIAELAFGPNAAIVPHSNPNLTYLIVIEGGGFVQVGDQRARVAAGEAVVWPPDVIHAAWTEGTPMRALVVEFAAPDSDPPLIEGGAVEPVPEPAASTAPEPAAPGPEPAAGDVALLRPLDPADIHESPEREPW
jgi:quercetin dioxygenase-like cupin family protein